MKNFSNIPQACSFCDYETAIEEYIQGIRQYGQGVSVYQIGNVGVAGISDIDLLVFIDDSLIGDFSVYSHVSGISRYLFMHDVYPLPKSMAKDIKLLTSIFDAKHRYGEHIISVTPQYSDIESVMFLNDIAIVSLSHEYEKWNEAPVINARLALARINSLKYPLKLLRNLALSKNNYGITIKDIQIVEKFINNFSEFRAKYFSFQPDDANRKLATYLKRSVSIASDLLGFIELVNSHQRWFSSELSYASFRYYDSFLTSSQLPMSIFGNLQLYGENDTGPISKTINRNFNSSGTVEYSDEYRILLQKRISLVDDASVFRNKRGIRYGVLWPFGISEPLSIKQKINLAIRRLMTFFLNWLIIK